MSAIESGNDWDDEEFTDRVDVIRETGRDDAFSPWKKNPSGQSQPEPQTILQDVPCKIRRTRAPEDVTQVSAGASQVVRVTFPFAVELTTGDILQPRPPSSGSPIKVGSYEYRTMLECGKVAGQEVT
jgi:hypothetical protein